MRKNRKLNISGTILNSTQLASYMEKIASNYSIQKYTSKDTYPIPSLKQAYNIILMTYKKLSEDMKLGIKIHSAGEWILDNFYIIEENVKSIQKELSIKKYKKMYGIEDGKYAGFARSYVLAKEIVAYTDCSIDKDIIYNCLVSYQKRKVLGMQEIWDLKIFLKIALIAQISEMCEKIYMSQLQKEKVESIIERIIEKKNNGFHFNSVRIMDNNKDTKFSFIEYMSFRLKEYGKEAIKYQKALEKEVEKIGLSVSQVIQLEHFNVANVKITVANGIKSLKEISHINFGDMFSYINATEEILKRDPTEVYSFMDEESKSLYRQKIAKLANKANVSEVYVAEKIIELSEKHAKNRDVNEKRKAHIGYYLIDKGILELEKELEIKIKKKNTDSSKFYVGIMTLLPLYFSFCLSILVAMRSKNLFELCFVFLFSYIPISEIINKIVNYILSKCRKPKILPKIDFENGIPPEASTFVVIPTILKNKEKVIEMLRKLEVYYLANKSENIYFALLGDCSEEESEKIDFDDEIVETGNVMLKELNEKYKTEKFPKFHFLYRKRTYSHSEEKYIGWERKRGLLVTFNKYIIAKESSSFLANSIEEAKVQLPNIKYVITLDSDTSLVLDSAHKLIGAMEHILNKPIIKNNKVVNGYGIMQPRIGLDLGIAQKSFLVELYSMQGGIDLYSNAISDIYQDLFDEGIFTGKGIYNVSVYNQILENEIPENTVLSHDLLEGNYLRCALLGDVILLDGYPIKYLSYIKRNHRWVRGDWQIIKWLNSNKLNTISKYKIYDNLRRSLVIIFSFLGIIFGCIFNRKLIAISILAIVISYLLDIINIVLFKESYIEGEIYADKKYSKDLGNLKKSIIKIILQISFLPYEAIQNFDAIVRSIYRMIRKKKLLEWVTAEDGEKLVKSNLKSHYKEMISNIIFGMVLLIFRNFEIRIISLLWLVGPLIAWYISLSREKKFKITKQDTEYLSNIAFRTWKFFETYINEENNFLIIDNYQEDREKKVVNRTSSTNIGLSLISVISAYDLGLISFKKAKGLIEKIIDKVNTLSKWNGHLYNWYNTKTLEPLSPRYISTVDSGNFVGYLYILKQFLVENKEKGNFELLIQNVDNLINNTDFSKLYNTENKLFSVGFNLEENKLTDSYYDFLASEARQASLVAIAKKDIESRHWSALSRTLTSLKGYKGLISWSGTAFEYLMPNINIKSYQGSLIDESNKFAIMCQMEYAKRLNVPWGISESAYNLKDLYNNYQYKAFGIPWLGLKRGLDADIVVSPYSTFLSLEEAKVKAIDNLKTIEQLGAFDKYGFYESIDFTKSRLKKNKKYEIIKTYMAHHQALILLSINNYINTNILKQRFYKNPEIESVDILLQERMPINMILTKEYKEKIENEKRLMDPGYCERVIEKHHPVFRNLWVISNDEYKIVLDDLGKGYSEYKGNLIYKFKPTSDINRGVMFYIKNVKTNEILKPYEESKVIFSPDKISYIKTDGKLKISTEIIVDPNKPLEIRNLEIENIGNTEEIYELISELEPILSEKLQEYSHPAFNKLFLKIEKENDIFYIIRKNRLGKESLFLGVTLYTDSEQLVDLEYEIDKKKYFGRNKIGIPEVIENNDKFSSEMIEVTDMILAIKKTFKIIPGQKIRFSLAIMPSLDKEYLKNKMERLQTAQDYTRIFEIAKARSEEELQFLKIKSKELATFQKVADYILAYAPNYKVAEDINYKKDDLWRFGISGDNPIIIAKVKKLEDINSLVIILKCYEYFKSKGIALDIVIINEEDNIYEKYVESSIMELIYKKQMQFLIGINGGIFIIQNNKENNDYIKTILIKSKLIIDLNKTDLVSFMEKLELRRWKSYKKLLNRFKVGDSKDIIPKLDKELKFYNGYGGYSLDGKEYHIAVNRKNKTPAPWSHILANKFFGTLLTENLSGFTWSKNSRLNRLTDWSNDSITNPSSETIYVVEDDSMWTLNSGVNPNENYYYITYGFGYSEFKNTNNELIQEVNVFVPENESLKINEIKIKNTANRDRSIKIYYYIKPVLGEDEYFTNTNIEVSKNENMIYARNIFSEKEFEKIMFVTSDLPIKSFTGNKDVFLGKDGLQNPRFLYEKLDGKNGLGKNSCIAIEIDIELKAFEKKNFVIILGEVQNKEENETINNFLEASYRSQELNNVKQKWNNIVQVLNVNTPSDGLNILLNGWLIYQTITSRINGRTGFYQSGGAYGFRDQLQDTIGMLYIDSKMLEEQILNCASHQFIEGDVLHWWHNETKRGVRTKFSDDLLWLVYATIEYISFTNDSSFLDRQIEYLTGEKLSEHEIEKYDIYYKSEKKGTLYEHCNRAIQLVLDRGLDPFPKIGCGDWNDGFSTVGINGKGQSIWLGFFLYDILSKWIGFCKNRKDKIYELYEKILEKLKKSLNSEGWDGRWYKRAITDDGEVIGTINSDEARIDSLCQSWDVISDAADNDKKYICMESVKNNLIDYENQIIKLFDPPFENSRIKPGYIKGYKPGIRENGGQYTHECCSCGQFLANMLEIKPK